MHKLPGLSVTHLVYHAIFKNNMYQLLYCILQHAHAGTWLHVTLIKN